MRAQREDLNPNLVVWARLACKTAKRPHPRWGKGSVIERAGQDLGDRFQRGLAGETEESRD